jgi:nicotinamidase-related amidase
VKRTLVIIDMQGAFSASRHKVTVAACKREILKSIECGDDILFVEFNPSRNNNTHDELTLLTEGYDRAYTVTKDNDDGSGEIFAAIIKYRLRRRHIAFCGVNVTACVSTTISGLIDKLSKGTRLVAICDALNGDTISGSQGWTRPHADWLYNVFNQVPYSKLELRYRERLHRYIDDERSCRNQKKLP